MSPGDALAALIEAYQNRESAAERWRSGGSVEAGLPGARSPGAGLVFGYVGADTPVELLTAAGVLPIRLAGDPSADHELGDLYLGRGVDPMCRSVMSRLLEGRYGRLDRVLVSRDCEGSLRLFYALRELRRIEPSLGVPETYLVDILHLPHRTTTQYNRARMVQLKDRLADWTGRPSIDALLASAIEAHDEQRRLLAEVAALRRCAPARLTGREFLAVVGAGTVMPVREHSNMLRELISEADVLPVHEGERVFLTGSRHDTSGVYEAIEAEGRVVVGEDHDWGDLLFERPVGAHTLDALVERYQYNGPTAQRATIRERARFTAAAARRCSAELLMGYVREGDEAPLWDFEAQRKAVALPSVLLERQTYGHIDLEGMVADPAPGAPDVADGMEG